MKSLSQPSDPSSGQSLDYRLPAAIVRYWDSAGGDREGLAEAELYRLTRGTPGFYRLAPGTLAITAQSGDPAIFDTALHLGRQLLRTTARQDPSLRVLVLPGELVLRDGLPASRVDLMVERAPGWLTELEPGSIHLTGWARGMLEQPYQIHELRLDTPAREQPPPIYRVGAEQPDLTPWRNPRLLNRPIRPVARPDLQAAGRELLGHRAWRVDGPVGCGKSHLVHQLLSEAKTSRLWLRGRSAHRAGGCLAEQILGQLAPAASAGSTDYPIPKLSNPQFFDRLRMLTSTAADAQAQPASERLQAVLSLLSAGVAQTFWVVVDDLEQSPPEELQCMVELLSMRELGQSFRLLLIGRAGGGMPPELESLPRLEVGPFDEKQMSEFSSQLFAGLSLPDSTQNRLRITTEGCPFALEEGMVALIRDKSLRRVYGSFFFAGQDTTGFSPSPRLLCHLQAEVFRLKIDTSLHLLSLVEPAAPAELVTKAAGKLGLPIAKRWTATAQAAGLTREAESPWGPGVGFSCPAFASTLLEGIDAASVPDLRVALGTTIAHQSRTGKALWEAYRLLRGTPPAVECLLQTLATSYAARIPRDVLLEVLTQELYRHRERDGDEETELQLLWKLLPLARKLGRLNEFTADLVRGVELAKGQPRRLLALAGLKAEMDQDAGRYSDAESTIRLALEAAKGADDRRQALLLIQLGRLHLDRERYDEAADLFQKLAQSLDQKGLTALAASCRYYLGNIAFHEERFEDALELHHQALEQRRSQDLNRVVGNSLTAMGAVYLALGNFPQALHFYREAQELLEHHGGDTDRAFPLLGLGRALNHLGDYTSASQPLRQALTLRQGKDDIAGEAVARMAVAENHLFLGQLDKAQDEATKALFQLNLLSRKTLQADAEQLLGRVQVGLRRYETALRHFQTALELHRAMDNKVSAAFDLAYLVDLGLTMEDEDAVAHHTLALEEALKELARPELEEQLHFRLFRGLHWLKRRGRSDADPQPSLERAYRELFRKASHLEPERRHYFLFQIDDYRHIVEAASRAGLSADLAS